MELQLIIVYFIVIIALIFDYVNGFHDSANSVATIVTTRVLSPRIAVLWAAFFNFVAFLFVGDEVAKTIGKGIVDPSVVDKYVLLGGLMGAIIWNLITWYYGLPSSSSHALVGGFMGAVIAKTTSLHWIIWTGILKIVIFIVVSPMLGLIFGSLIMTGVSWLCYKGDRKFLDKLFRKLQLVSAAMYSLGHGANDAQKTMGIIAVLLFTAHNDKTMNLPGWLYNPPNGGFYVPTWVILACYIFIALGTMSGGWRIIKTMGSKITKLRPVEGFCAEASGAITLLGTALGGIPVSTTHTITGAIAGVGAIKSLRSVRWKVATRIAWAWILTIPLSSLIAGIAYLFIKVIFIR